jgi:hypothetical protein
MRFGGSLGLCHSLGGCGGMGRGGGMRNGKKESIVSL